MIDRGTRDARSSDVVAAMLAPNTSHSGYVTFTPVTRPELATRCELISPVERSGLSGLWEEVPRPFRQTSQDYVGRDLERQRFTVLFEGEPGNDGGEPASVQPQIAALLALGHPLPGEYAPPLLNLDGPVQGRRGAQQWQLQACEPAGDQLRREADGYIWQAAYDVTLAVYVTTAALTLTNPPSPAAAADAAAKAGATTAASSTTSTSGRTYVVRSGDNLNRIAQSQLGNASRWREIATLNKLANPNLILPGQILRLP
jgi:LysM repeat protein